jgi:alpha-amylase
MKKVGLFLLFIGISITAFAQNKPRTPKPVILQGFYIGPNWTGTGWDTTHSSGVPCPADPRSFPITKQWYYDAIAGKANEIASSGFTAVWFPSVTKGTGSSYGNPLKQHHQSGGIYDAGYGVFDDYDLGDKLQKGTIPTRYGTRDQLTRCVAMMHANGLDVYHDFILNQRNGNNVKPVPPMYQWFRYKNAFGADSGGRFPKYTRDFHNPGKSGPASPGGTVDPHTPGVVFPDGTPTGRTEGYWGPDFAHITGERGINGSDSVWCAEQLIKWGDWLLKATDMQGYRLDDIAGVSWDFARRFVNYGAMKDKFSIAEMVGSWYSVYELQTWMRQLMGKQGGNFTTFDQSLQPVLLTMCKKDKFNMTYMQSKYLTYNSKKPGESANAINPAAGSADPGKGIWYRSLMAIDPEQAVTVLNEVDMEAAIGALPRAALPKQCLMGYAYILTIGYGKPCISSKDWNTDVGCYGSTMIDGQTLNHHLNKLIWCHNFICNGNLTNEQVNAAGTVYAFEHTGSKPDMVFLNSDHDNAVLDTVSTTIANGTVLVDYTDHNIKAIVKHGRLILTVPANKDGRGYLVMAPPGITGSFTPVRKSTTQEWDASGDLSIRPASDKKQMVCRIWVDKNTVIKSALLDFNTDKWAANTALTLEIDKSSPDSLVNVPVAERKYTVAQRGKGLDYKLPVGAGPGFYSFWVTGDNLPDLSQNYNEWFNLQNSYTAPMRDK